MKLTEAVEIYEKCKLGCQSCPLINDVGISSYKGSVCDMIDDLKAVVEEEEE